MLSEWLSWESLHGWLILAWLLAGLLVGLYGIARRKFGDEELVAVASVFMWPLILCVWFYIARRNKEVQR